jgi:hypothetical protein
MCVLCLLPYSGKFSWGPIFADGQSSSLFNFANAHDLAHYTLYNRAYFAGLIFADSRFSPKTAKIGPHKNFTLYSIVMGLADLEGHFLWIPLTPRLCLMVL